jgi:hypothetical protein
MTVAATIIDIAVTFDRPCDRVDLCCANNRFGKIGPDLTLLCANCGALRGRLQQSTAAQLVAVVSKFGSLDAPIILRAGGRQ